MTINTIILGYFTFKSHLLFKKIAIVLYIRYVYLIKVNKERRIYSNRDSFFSTGLLFYFLFDILIISPHPIHYFEDLQFSMPSFNGKPSLNYKLNHILSIYMVLRVILLLRSYLNCTIFKTSRSFRLW